MSLSLTGQNTGQKQKGQSLPVPAQCMAPVSALRSLSSVALSSARVQPVYHLFLCTLLRGDISTLQIRGHFYFALTGFHKTFRFQILADLVTFRSVFSWE